MWVKGEVSWIRKGGARCYRCWKNIAKLFPCDSYVQQNFNLTFKAA